MKKLIIAFASSLLCLILLCGSLLAESGMTLGASLGDSGTVGDSGTIGNSGSLNEETEVPDRIDNAIKKGADIDLSATGTVLTATELSRIAESGRSVRLTGNGYIIMLNPYDIPADIGDCDFNISVNAVNKTTVIREIAVYKNSVSIIPVVSGDSRLSFNIYIPENLFNETGINSKGKLYSVETDYSVSEHEIIYNAGNRNFFAEFKMNLASFYIASEKKPVSADDEIEVFDPAFGSDDEIEVGDPGYKEQEIEGEASAAEEDEMTDGEYDLGAINTTTFARTTGIDGNPATGTALPVIVPLSALIFTAAAVILKRRKK